jgi:hypothetical protein
MRLANQPLVELVKFFVPGTSGVRDVFIYYYYYGLFTESAQAFSYLLQAMC